MSVMTVQRAGVGRAAAERRPSVCGLPARDAVDVGGGKTLADLDLGSWMDSAH